MDVPSGRRWTYGQLDSDTDARGAGAAGPGHRPGRPGRHLGPELRRVGAAAVRDGQDRRHPGQHQPGLPQPRAGLRAAASPASGCWSARRASRPATTGPWSRRSAAACPTWSGSSTSARRTGTSWWRPVGDAGRGRRGRAGRAAGRLAFDDPINIQYTSGTTGFPKGATLSHHNILNNGFFIGEGCRYTAADRVCIPVPFYHCFGMVMGNLGCTTHGSCIVIPAPGFDPAATLAAVAGRAVHLAVRRADHVHRRAGPARLRAATTCPRCAPASWPARRARSR